MTTTMTMHLLFHVQVATNHAIVGLVVLALVVVQVGLGLLRPGTEHKARRVFNWGHRITGWVTQLLAGKCKHVMVQII